MRGDGCSKLGWLGADGRALAELLKVVSDDERAAGKTAFDNPTVSVLRTERYVIHVNRIVGTDRVDLLLALKLGNCDLRD